VSGKQNSCTRSARLIVRGTNYALATADGSAAEVSAFSREVEVQHRALGGGSDAPEPFS